MLSSSVDIRRKGDHLVQERRVGRLQRHVEGRERTTCAAEATKLRGVVAQTMQMHRARAQSLECLAMTPEIVRLIFFSRTLELRVRETFDAQTAAGIHVGRLNAGVLGEERLIYDTFGDTVNTASRVMSTCGGAGTWLSAEAAAIIAASVDTTLSTVRAR